MPMVFVHQVNVFWLVYAYWKLGGSDLKPNSRKSMIAMQNAPRIILDNYTYLQRVPRADSTRACTPGVALRIVHESYHVQ